MTARSVKVSLWKGRNGDLKLLSLAAMSDTSMDYKAEHRELAEWWPKDVSSRAKLTDISRMPNRDGGDVNDGQGRMGGFRTSLKEAKELGQNEKPDWVNVRGQVVGFPENEDKLMFYDACPNMLPGGEKRQCGKKVDGFVPGRVSHCQKCDMVVEKVVPRYLANVHIADHSDSVWVRFFDDAGVEFFGCPAADLKDNPKKTAALKSSLQGQPVTLTLKVKENISPDGIRRNDYVAASAMQDRPGQKRCQVIRSASDWAADCRNMLRDLDRYAAGDASAAQVP